MPRYELSDGRSHKFWEIELAENQVTTRYGRIGTKGTSTTKEWPTNAKAQAAYNGLIAAKTKKGYGQVASPAKGAQPSPKTSGKRKPAKGSGTKSKGTATAATIKRKKLTQKQYLASFDFLMRSVEPGEDFEAVPLRDYVDECIDDDDLPTTRAELEVLGAYAGTRRPLVHIMLGWGERARQLVIVTDIEARTIVGDWTFDMDADWGLYRLPRPSGALAPKAAASVLGQFGGPWTVSPRKASNGQKGWEVDIYESTTVPHDLLAALQHVVKLTFAQPKAAELEAVLASPALDEVEELNLSDVSRNVSLEPLARLHGLRELELSFGTGGQDLSPLAHLKRLERLNISRCNASDIEALGELERLEELAMHWFPKLGSIAPLARLAKLKRVSLSSIPKRDDIKSVAALREAVGDPKKGAAKKGAAKKGAAKNGAAKKGAAKKGRAGTNKNATKKASNKKSAPKKSAAKAKQQSAK